MQYIIEAYAKDSFSSMPEWKYINGYSNGILHGLVMCGYTNDIGYAQRFLLRSDARKAANRLLTRETKGFMRDISKAIVVRIP